jgi:hypothetical protein
MDRSSRCPTCRHDHRQSAIVGYDPPRTRTWNQLIKRLAVRFRVIYEYTPPSFWCKGRNPCAPRVTRRGMRGRTSRPQPPACMSLGASPLPLSFPTNLEAEALRLKALVERHTGSFGLKVEPLPVEMVPPLNL